jgi:hypothetical protein
MTRVDSMISVWYYTLDCLTGICHSPNALDRDSMRYRTLCGTAKGLYGDAVVEDVKSTIAVFTVFLYAIHTVTHTHNKTHSHTSTCNILIPTLATIAHL